MVSQYIIRQGEEGSRFYIINEGEVRCTRARAGIWHIACHGKLGDGLTIVDDNRGVGIGVSQFLAERGARAWQISFPAPLLQAIESETEPLQAPESEPTALTESVEHAEVSELS